MFSVTMFHSNLVVHRVTPKPAWIFRFDWVKFHVPQSTIFCPVRFYWWKINEKYSSSGSI